MTIADLIAVLQTLPPDARACHFSWDDTEGKQPPEIYFGIIHGEPLLWTEYDHEVVDWHPGGTKTTVEQLWKELQAK